MLHKEYGVGYGATNGTTTPLVDNTGGLTESPPWRLGIVEEGNEADSVSLTISMTMR